MLDRPVVRSAYGLRLAANYGDDTFGYYVSGAYGFFYWDRLATLDFPFVLLDIGANQGLYAIGAARSPNCVASYAFEPVPRTFGYLKKNIALNGANACCVPVMKAIGEKTGVAEMALKDGHSGVATLASSNPLMEESGSKLAVEMLDADGLADLIEPLSAPVVVKVDVEGYEDVVIGQLLGSRFADRIAEVFFEVNADWTDVESLKSQLRDAGLTEFTRIGAGPQADLLAVRSRI